MGDRFAGTVFLDDPSEDRANAKSRNERQWAGPGQWILGQSRKNDQQSY